MQIRKAEYSDYDAVIHIFLHAREFMRQNGNPYQWNDIERQKEAYQKDIEEGHLFVMEQDDEIVGMFALIIGEDPTYLVIEDGEWLDTSLYGTIHRIASSGKVHGIFEEAIRYCWNVIEHLRIDTHEKNLIMQKCILNAGFAYCGIIHIHDGSERLAFEKIK